MTPADDLRAATARAVVVDARRTPIRRRGGALAGHPATTLAAAVLRDLSARLPHDLRIDDVLLGSSRPLPGNLARIAALEAGLGNAVPGVTIDRQCGGGLEAVRLAAALVGNGDADVVLAGGVDSASVTDAESSVTAGPSPQARFTPPGHPDPPVGEAADALAAALGISRQRQDAYAERSYRLHRIARDGGVFGAELVPVGTVLDDGRPREPDARTLARLRPAFTADAGRGSTVTAGNACGISDGAAAVSLVSERFRAEHDLPGLRVLGAAAGGSDPALPGLGAVEATRAVLERTGVRLADLAVLEVTEAFAAQVLALTQSLGLPDPSGATGEEPSTAAWGPLVCPDGGAIALGHPWGASGALLLVRLFSRLVRRGPARDQDGGPLLGLATCAVAGGQGVAVLVQRVG